MEDFPTAFLQRVERFIDREAEMETLEREYERKGSALVVIYGRRRVGKTTLRSGYCREGGSCYRG